METLATLRASVRNNLSETGTEFFDDAAVNDHLNRALKKVYADFPQAFPSSYRTTMIPGTASYLLPPRLVHPSATYIKNPSSQWYRLTYWPPAILDQYRQYAARRPSVNLWLCAYRIVEMGTAVDVLFEPSAYMEMAVAGCQVPLDLVDDTDKTELAPWATHVVIDLATAACKFMDEENAEYQLAMAGYKEVLRDWRARRTRRQVDQINMTRPMRGYSRGRFPWIG